LLPAVFLRAVQQFTFKRRQVSLKLSAIVSVNHLSHLDQLSISSLRERYRVLACLAGLKRGVSGVIPYDRYDSV